MKRKTKLEKMTSKTTDIIQKTEQQLLEELQILKDPNVGKERKTKAKRNIKNYEKYLRDNSDQEINGKKYPERLSWSDDKPMNKKEVLKLIDSVPDQGVSAIVPIDFPEHLAGVFLSDSLKDNLDIRTHK